jgi:putative polyhydroxyalkanoate system protein
VSKPIVVDVPHQLGRAEARRRLEQGFGRIRGQIVGKALAVDERWEGEQLHFSAAGFGQQVSGRVDIFDESVRIEVDLPWFLAAIAEKLQGRIRREGRLLLEKK